MIRLETAVDTLGMDSKTGGLVSLRRKTAPEIELIAPGADRPAFVIQYLDEQQRFRQIDSRDASRLSCDELNADSPRQSLSLRYQNIGGLPLHVTLLVEADREQMLSRWTLRLQNEAGLRITDVQYPFVVLPYGLDDPDGDHDHALVWPVAAGRLLQNPQPYDLEPDSPHAWQMRPENSTVLHYPGFITAQFLAYYSARCGVYMAADDTAGHIKLIKPVHHSSGLRLGFSHLGDWPEQGERRLEYGIRLGSFEGDWYSGGRHLPRLGLAAALGRDTVKSA